ncbi:MAG: hypothetical protein KDE03_07345 [Rhodobacteraceae bacterium]|nr:hypothetical protein [Paracoccaceae bacterium]
MIAFVRNVLAAFIVGTCIPASAVFAETITVRSGEHGDFSRLVLDLKKTHPWMLGRGDDGYELRLDASDVTFDLSGVFRLIGRQRISDLVEIGSGAGLHISLTCNCHAQAFETASGAVVIDVLDGAADPDSPFERRLQAPIELSTNTKTAAEDKPTVAEDPLATEEAQAETAYAASEQVSHVEAPIPAERGISTPPRTSDYLGQTLPDKQLKFFWGGMAPSDPLPEESVAEKPAEESREENTSVPEMPVDRTTVAEQGVPSTAIDHDRHETGPGELRLPLIDDAQSELAPLDQLPFPNRRLAQTEAELFRQLGRAAAQGLIEVDLFDKSAQSGRTKKRALTGPESAPQEAGDPHESEPFPHGHIQSETSIDRDMLAGDTHNQMTGDGLACLPDSAFAISSWGDDRPIGIQIAEKRARLVGEFDRPNPDFVLDLARLYLYFGFGVEAQAVLRAFPGVEAEGAPLDEIALILDNRHPPASGILSAMTDCDTSAALWALLAPDELLPGTTINTAAVNRAFSGLPLHLRKLLGPEVSERLLKFHHADAARSIRNAISRAETNDENELHMIAAQIALASSHPEIAESQLEPIALSNSPDAPQALVLTIESKIDRGEAVSPALAESAGALAYELRHAPIGAQLEKAHILALSSASDFSAAFFALQEWRKREPNELQAPTFRSLLQAVTKRGNDQVFMDAITAHMDDPLMKEADLELRLDAADRMGALGFSNLPRKLLEGEAAHTLRGRRLAARLALAEYDPQGALDILSGLRDAQALRLQADALAMMGEHLSAAERYSQSGEAEAGSRQSWQGGDYVAAARHAPQEIGQAITSLGLDRETGTAGAVDTAGGEVSSEATSPAGPLAEARNLIGESQSARQAIADLFAYSSPAEKAK